LYIDATYGGGGHTSEIIKRGGKVLGIDQDQESIDYSHLAEVRSPALTSAKGNFMLLTQIAKDNNFSRVDGILFDLGVSSHQINNPQRGFSFQSHGPLDMRMDQGAGVSASALIDVLNSKQLENILKNFGQLSNAKSISEKIISSRPIKTTDQLAGLFSDFKTRQLVFQSLRIAVNAELVALESGLSQSLELLKPGGRIVAISFHSLEDRIIKNYFVNWEKKHLGKIITKKPIVPDLSEIQSNSRSKSSKLRCFQKYD
jgi:16S rRNA (cytosine1402-N4)-methyltransferase